MSDGWEDILEEDEHILWQGRPDGAVRIDLSKPANLVGGLFFMVFSTVWMWGAFQSGGLFWVFGLMFFGSGLYSAVGVHFWKAYVRQCTYYTLTSKRAFVATDHLGKKSLHSYPIKDSTDLEFLDGPTQTIIFAKITKSNDNGSYEVPVGFEFIHDGRDVMKLMRGLQQDQA